MKEPKKIYASPELDIIKTENSDVIATSPIELPMVPASHRRSAADVDLYDI